jgi:hypothetical protein
MRKEKNNKKEKTKEAVLKTLGQFSFSALPVSLETA